MKPWFEKAVVEGDIIKFPEPEKTVIQMPNVASYPDFLTGVKDLHNRKEKGEISQDSHDKLYQDLIHRFMRKESSNAWFEDELSEAPLLTTADYKNLLQVLQQQGLSVNPNVKKSRLKGVPHIRVTNPTDKIVASLKKLGAGVKVIP